MIPSDHFVRFYNEVFKFLDGEKGGLEKFYERISKLQEFHCLDNFRRNGLKGVYDYYQKIYKEENCEGATILNEHEIVLQMDKCPSLSKALDNDAGASPKYCLHCPGWTAPLYRKAGLYQVYDLMGLDNPQCCEWIYDDIELARKKQTELLKTRPKDQILVNFE